MCGLVLSGSDLKKSLGRKGCNRRCDQTKRTNTLCSSSILDLWSCIVCFKLMMLLNGQRSQSNGGRYMLWYVTNLAGSEIAVFLFGEAYDAHWKEGLGTVVALLNPKRREEKPGQENKNEDSGPAFTVSNGGQVLVIGLVSHFVILEYFDLKSSEDLSGEEGRRAALGFVSLLAMEGVYGPCWHGAGAYRLF